MRRRSPTLRWNLLPVVALMTAAAACGQASASPPPPPVLPAGAVSYLESTVRPLTADDLTKETTAPALASGLSRWGFVVGSDRLFQAANHNRHSHRLQFVDSRTLLFRTPAGAESYVRYVHDHPTEMFGAPPKQTALVSRGRHGWAIDLASCACHMSNPAVVGITSDGTRVTWLEINGATASTAKLAALMGKAP